MIINWNCFCERGSKISPYCKLCRIIVIIEANVFLSSVSLPCLTTNNNLCPENYNMLSTLLFDSIRFYSTRTVNVVQWWQINVGTHGIIFNPESAAECAFFSESVSSCPRFSIDFVFLPNKVLPFTALKTEFSFTFFIHTGRLHLQTEAVSVAMPCLSLEFFILFRFTFRETKTQPQQQQKPLWLIRHDW